MALEALKEKGRVAILAGVWFLQGPHSPVQRLATRHSHSYFEKYWTLISSILPCNNPLIMPGSWNSRGLHWLFLEHLQVFPHYCLLCGWMIIEVSLTKATRFLWSGCPSPSSKLAQGKWVYWPILEKFIGNMCQAWLDPGSRYSRTPFPSSSALLSSRLTPLHRGRFKSRETLSPCMTLNQRLWSGGVMGWVHLNWINLPICGAGG